MAIMATGSNKEFKPTPEGNHMAVCFRVIDLGTQRWEYQGEPQIGRKVLIAWELHGEDEEGNPLTMDDGRPLSASSTYTLSLGKKAILRAHLEAWRGKAFTEAEMAGFDVSQLLGQPCMVSIKHTSKNGKTYANVAAVSRFPAALKAHKPTAVNQLQLFDISEPDEAILDSLPDWIKEKVNESVERSAPKRPAGVQKREAAAAITGTGFDDMDDDVPF